MNGRKALYHLELLRMVLGYNNFGIKLYTNKLRILELTEIKSNGDVYGDRRYSEILFRCIAPGSVL